VDDAGVPYQRYVQYTKRLLDQLETGDAPPAAARTLG
jgi:hypothetical protein